jgi:hypothetical protein
MDPYRTAFQPSHSRAALRIARLPFPPAQIGIDGFCKGRGNTDIPDRL